jgi:hypothetical protein
MGGGQGGVTAEIDFGGRGEPAEPEFAALRLHEGRFGLVHFGRERLHPLIRHRAVQVADTGGVALERGVGEGVDEPSVGMGQAW